MRKTSVAGCVFLLLLSGCVSESTIVGNDRPGQPRTDMKEAARTRMSLGLNYLQRGDNTQAKYNLEKAKQLAPDLADVDNALAYYYQQVGELDQAEDSYRDALRKDSDNADTYNNFGAFLCQHQKYQQAEELLLAAIKRPGYIRVADSYENLAFCSLEQKDYVKYHQYLKQSLQHNSNRSSALYNMAVIEYAMGNLAEAKRWQARLHQLGQVSAEATLLRYIVAYYSGDIPEQQTAEKFLLSVYPTSPEANMVLASDFSKSTPEQMRRDYKNSIVGDANGDASKKGVVDQPKMKIVKRKSASGSAVTASALPMAETAPLPAEALGVAAQKTVAAEITQNSQTNNDVMTTEPALTSAADDVSALQNTAAQAGTKAETQTAGTTSSTDPIPESSMEPVPAEIAEQAGSEPLTTAVTATTNTAGELAALQAPEPMPTETVTTADTSAEIVSDDSSTSGDATLAASPESESRPDNQNADGQNAGSHKVAAGETLYSIASRYRLSVSELQALNNLNDAALIKTGQVLKLTAEGAAENLPEPANSEPQAQNKEVPVAPATYQVKEGESMFSISYKYNIKLDTLLKWNNMTVDKPLSIGQTIYLQDPATSSL